MYIFNLLICFLPLITLVVCHINYSDHIVVKLKPSDVKHIDLLKQFEIQHNLDFWTQPHHDLSPILTHLSCSQLTVLQRLNQSNICYEIVSNNLQQLIDKQRQKRSYNSPKKRFSYESYHSYSEIVTELKSIAKNKNSNKITAKVFSIGLTYEKRAIPAITITGRHNVKHFNKRIVVFECGMHSREWISPAACLWIINDLLNNDTNAKRLDKFNFLIVPVINSDGYDYTWNYDRMWRKTRSKLENSTCIGVDLNRNWDTNWCAKHGASDNPCSKNYCGDRAFSERESLAMAIQMYEKREKIAAYFSFHSYKQMWMYPWGHTKNLIPNHQFLHNLSRDAVEAIKSTNGRVFKYGPISNTIYAVTGGSVDWVYDTIGVKTVFAMELRDNGEHGFLLPDHQIRHASLEVWNGIKAVIDQI